MNKLCLMPKSLEEINLNVDSIIIGLKNFNNLNVIEISIDEIEELCNECNKEVYISINKIIHEFEIPELEKILKKIESINISGILFDDLSILQIIKENKLNIKLIWSNTHQVTNYNTINNYINNNVMGAFISPDITLNEIMEIGKNTKAKLFVPLYGMFEIFSSNRFLISNYLKYINSENDSNKYYIENKETKYPIYEDNNGTHIINGNIINGLGEYIEILKNGIDYTVINSYGIDNIDKVIENFNLVKSMYENNDIDNDKINKLSFELTDDINKGFLYTETIYKVKSDVNE